MKLQTEPLILLYYFAITTYSSIAILFLFRLNTALLMSYGQFIDHDLAETPVNRCDDNSPIECCEDIKCPNCDCKHLFLV